MAGRLGIISAPVIGKGKKIADPDPLKTVHFIGDTHVGGINADRLQAILDDQPITPVAHVQVGDTTDTATGEQDTAALAFLGGLPATWYSICGGHDIWGDGRTPADWATVYGMAGQHYTVDLGFVKLICLGMDTASSYVLSSTALAFLEDELTDAGETPCLIVNHLPLYNTVISTDLAKYYGSLAYNWYQRDSALIKQIIADHDNAKAWICGHTHNPYKSPGFVKTLQRGTHRVISINCSSPYYTDKVGGQDLAEAIVTIYVTLDDDCMQVRLRDHLAKRWLRQWNRNLETGMPENGLLLDERFITAVAAPIGAQRYAEPGPGGIDLTDTSNLISISGGKLVISGTVTAGDGYFVMDALTRKCGRAFKFDLIDRTTISVISYFGLSALQKAAWSNIGCTYGDVNTPVPRLEQSSLQSLTMGTNDHTLLCVMRSVGGLLLARDSGDSEHIWKIAHIYGSGCAPLYAQLRLAGAAHNFKQDNLWVGDLGGRFESEFGMASIYEETTENGETATAGVSGWFEHTILAQEGVTQELMFRRQDDDNTWILRLDQAASQVTLITKTSGVETVRAGPTAFTFVDGTKYRVMVWSTATNAQRTFIDDVAIQSANSSTHNTKTGIKVSHAGEKLAWWPLTLDLTAEGL